MTPTQAIQSHLHNPSISYWLKDALRASMKRDPVDALHDAEELAFLLKAYLDEQCGRQRSIG